MTHTQDVSQFIQRALTAVTGRALDRLKERIQHTKE